MDSFESSHRYPRRGARRTETHFDTKYVERSVSERSLSPVVVHLWQLHSSFPITPPNVVCFLWVFPCVPRRATVQRCDRDERERARRITQPSSPHPPHCGPPCAPRVLGKQIVLFGYYCCCLRLSCKEREEERRQEMKRAKSKRETDGKNVSQIPQRKTKGCVCEWKTTWGEHAAPQKSKKKQRK